MASKAGIGFKIWTAFLSAAFALLLFPNIVGRLGVGMSLLYTGLGVGFIWFLHFAIGRLLERAVSAELKRRSRDKHENEPEREPEPPA